MKIKFCGAAQTVTGSAHLITLDSGYSILFDCGLFQGRQAYIDILNQSWHFDPANIDVLILSHAHIDHAGRIPKLCKDGFKGKIYATHASADLAKIMLMDSAHIQEKDSEYHNKKRKKNEPNIPPLYTIKDAEKSMMHFAPVNYNEWIKINDECQFIYRDAGHILGSANITLNIRRADGKYTTIGFTGDIGRPERPILRDPQTMSDIDYLICESTYGNRLHEGPPDDEKSFWDVIYKTCYIHKGKVVIPAFSLGRTQEIVYMLDKMHHQHKIARLPIYVDSPLSTNATDIYRKHAECFNEEIKKYLLIDDNPFGFNDLKYIQDVADSKALNESDEPCIIISASGMAEAGRIVHHLRNTIDDSRNTVLIVGYCAEGTLGRRIKDGNNIVKILGGYHTVRAQVAVMDSFSAHGDRDELTHFIKKSTNHKLKHIFLVHGELEAQHLFTTHLKANGFKTISIPTIGEEIIL